MSSRFPRVIFDGSDAARSNEADDDKDGDGSGAAAWQPVPFSKEVSNEGFQCSFNAEENEAAARKYCENFTALW